VTPIRDTQELAAQLWRRGLHRWFDAHAGWTVQTPRFGERWIEFHATRPDHALRLRVQPSGDPSADPPTYTGRHLQVLLLEGGASGHALARTILAVDRRGLALDLPIARSLADGVLVPWRELFIADSCNLKCRFCCESTRVNQGGLMPWEAIDRELHRARDEGIGLIQFMGGEASIHPRFADALQLARDLGMQTYTITNLLRWQDRAFAERVGPLLDEVMISVHAASQETGGLVTGRAAWWSQFSRAVQHAAETMTARRFAATVLSRQTVSELDAIANVVLELGCCKWVMGNAVPVLAAAGQAIEMNLDLTELRARRGEFQSLHSRCASSGCTLVFFCIPHCVLGPELWHSTHDQMLRQQPLDGEGRLEDVNFWSEADFHGQPAQVSLARRHGAPCQGCERRSECGGYFSDYLDLHGDGELGQVGSV